MTGRRHLIIPDPHAHPSHNNYRAVWIGHFMKDVKPDVVVNLGDTADLASLSSYDKGKASFNGRSYAKDIEAHNDFQEKLWEPTRKAKKKKPYSVTLIGNHEQRIDRVLEYSPEYEGTIGYKDLDLYRNYDDVVHYNGGTPGSIVIDGVMYAHYLTSGVMGRPIGGTHQAYTLLNKQHMSCTVGHSHTLDYYVQAKADGSKIHGLVAGCLQDYDTSWAGDAQRFWYRCVILKDNVADGQYDLQIVSLNTLKERYGHLTDNN